MGELFWCKHEGSTIGNINNVQRLEMYVYYSVM